MAIELDKVPVGTWVRLPNTKLSLAGVLPDPWPADAGQDPGSIIRNWCGGYWDSNRREYGVCGGGHQGGALNWVCAIKIPAYGATLGASDYLWRAVVKEPLDYTPNFWAANGYPGWTRDWPPSTSGTSGLQLGINPDGTPRARHTYGVIGYLPSVDRFWMGPGGEWPLSGSGNTNLWQANPDIQDGVSSWVHKGDILAAGTSAGTDGYSCWDAGAAKMIFGWGGFIQRYDPTTGAVEYANKAGFENPPIGTGIPSGAVVDPARRRLWLMGDSGVMRWLDLTGPANTMLTNVVPVGGDTEILSNGALASFIYDPVADRIIGWRGGLNAGDNRTLYSCSLDVGAGNAYVWTKTVFGGDDPGVMTPNGTYNRFQYIGDGFAIVVNDYAADVYIVRLDGTAAFESWAQRSTRSSVVRAVSFDTPSEVDPYTVAGEYLPGQFNIATRDTNTKAGGIASLRFSVPPNSGSDVCGYFAVNATNGSPNQTSPPTAGYSYPTQFGEGQEFYVQWRQRFSPEFLAHFAVTSGEGGFKQIILGEGDRGGTDPGGPLRATSCSQLEAVMNNNAYYGVPQMYHSCGGKDGTFEGLSTGYGASDFKMQNGMPSPFCLYSKLIVGNTGGCVAYVANEWMTFQIHVKVGAWYRDGYVSGLAPGTDTILVGAPTITVSGNTATFSVGQTNAQVRDYVSYTGGTLYLKSKTSDTVWTAETNWYTGINPPAVTNAPVQSIRRYKRRCTVRAWAAREGQQPQLIIDRKDYDLANNYNAGNGWDGLARYGKIWLLPYITGKDPTVTYPEAFTWYDELIIATQYIANPLTETSVAAVSRLPKSREFFIV